MLHHPNNQSKNQYRGHFSFNKAEVTIHLVFIGAVIYLAMFEILPKLVITYPPE